jgi:hypothetical protein
MKEKILYLIIGVLIGAMCATGVFMIINKNSDSNDSRNGEGRETFRNFDPNNLPEGFDPNNMPQRGQGGRTENGGNTTDTTNTNTNTL